MILIESLYELKLISSRALNLCIYNDIYDTKALDDFYQKNKSFFSLRNCGIKVNDELIRICKTYSDPTNKRFAKFDMISTEYRVINQNEKTLYTNYFKYLLLNSSVRLKNAIFEAYDNDFDFEIIENEFIKNDIINFFKIRNIGRKTLVELYDLIRNLELSIKYINIKSSFIQSDIALLFEYIDDAISNIENNSQKNYDIFNLLNINDKPSYITSSKITIERNITRERIRQILDDFKWKLYRCVYFIKTLDKEFVINLMEDDKSNIIKFDKEKIQCIKDKYNLRYSDEFMFYIICVLFSDYYISLGKKNSFILKNMDMINLQLPMVHNYLIRKDYIVPKLKFVDCEVAHIENIEVSEIIALNYDKLKVLLF